MHVNYVLLCPQCHSPAVAEEGGLADEASCESCGYAGARGTFLVHTFQTDTAIDRDRLLQHLSNDLAHTLMAVGIKEVRTPLFAIYFGRWLHRWGFAFWSEKNRDEADRQFKSYCMQRYARAMGEGILRAVMQCRSELEKERIEHERKYPN